MDNYNNDQVETDITRSFAAFVDLTHETALSKSQDQSVPSDSFGEFATESSIFPMI